MHRPTRRSLPILLLIVALAVLVASVATGFRTGWLEANDSERSVGRLRPADLTNDITAPADSDTTTPTASASSPNPTAGDPLTGPTNVDQTKRAKRPRSEPSYDTIPPLTTRHTVSNRPDDRDADD